MTVQEKTIRRVTWTGLALNCALATGKFLVGWFGASQALIADAVHSLSDMATDVAVLVGVRYWSAPPDASHPYGHAKIETLVTALIGFALAGAGAAIGYEALATLHLHETNQRTPGLSALMVALFSIVSKEYLFRWTRKYALRERSSALEANAWHHRSDAISSIPAAAAILIAYLVPGWAFVDKVGAIIVSTFILHAAWMILRKPLLELSDAGMPQDTAEIVRIALSVPGTVSVHEIRTRMSGQFLLADLHLLVPPDMTVLTSHRIATEVRRRLLKSNLGIQDVVVHIEPSGAAHEEEQPASGNAPLPVTDN